MKNASWKDAYLQSIGLQEAKYTNIHNKIKGIRNLSRKDADMIADIDPAVLGPVVKALAPMFEDVNEEVKEVSEAARMPQYGKTKFDGKEFDRKKENKNIKNMIKSLHKVAKMQDDFQYTAEMGYNSKGGNPNDIYKNLVAAEQALYSYMIAVDRGVYDGTIEVDRD